MLTPHDVQAQQLIDLVYREAQAARRARLRRLERLFTDDAYYWVPLQHGQPDGLNHTSHMYEDKLLRELRIERLKSPRAFSQQPISRCHHLLQQPNAELLDAAANHFVTRTEFHYSEARGDEMLMLVGTAFHHFRVEAGELRFTLKRVNLLNCDAALPSIQLFI